MPCTFRPSRALHSPREAPNSRPAPYGRGKIARIFAHAFIFPLPKGASQAKLIFKVRSEAKLGQSPATPHGTALWSDSSETAE